MKKIIYAISAISLLLIGCTNNKQDSYSSKESSFVSSSEESSLTSSDEESSYHEDSSEDISQSDSESISSSDSELSITSEEVIPEIITTPRVRMPGEFEPVQAVTVTYPNNLPLSVFKEIAEDDKLIVLVNPNSYGASRITKAKQELTNYGVNLDNVSFLDANIDDDYYAWIRDFSPFYVFNNDKMSAVNFNYNRPQRREQNKIPSLLADYFDIDYYSMNLTHTGGNMMQDGYGAAMSDDLVINENNNDEEKVRQLMSEYTGNDKYHITIDPQGDYIAHIDCWGKIVAPDKIIIARVPKNHSRYRYYEQVADYFANELCCYGYPYRIYRIDELGDDNHVMPYTNSLIINKKVLLPVGNDDTYNQKAIEVYQEALPGYEIVPFKDTNDSQDCWYNTDALHCRTHEVPDFNMLFINHKPLFGQIDDSEDMRIIADFKCYSGAPLDINNSKIYISVNDSTYQEYSLNQYETSNNYYYDLTNLKEGDKVSYYIKGYDELGNYNIEPSCGELDPHHFEVI